MSAARNKAVVRAFYRHMNDRRFDDVWALFTGDDAVWSGGGNPPRSSSTVADMRQIIVDPMPVFVGGGIDFTVHDMIGEGDRVAAEVSCHAELVNGRVYENQYHMLFRFEGDLIAEVKEYSDTLHAHEVFGP